MRAEGQSLPHHRRAVQLLIEVPAVVVTFVMMLHVGANAVLRTFANYPLPNTLEIVQYWYLPSVALLGFVAAQHRAQHIAADLIFEHLPQVTKRYVLAASFVLASAVAAGFAYFGWGEAVHAMEIGRTAGVSGLISWPVYFLVPIVFASLTVQFLLVALRAVRHPEDHYGPSEPDEVAFLDEESEAFAGLEKK